MVNFQSSGLFSLLYVGFCIEWSAEKAVFCYDLGPLYRGSQRDMEQNAPYLCIAKRVTFYRTVFCRAVDSNRFFGKEKNCVNSSDICVTDTADFAG